MTGERQVLCVGDYLIRRACRLLPPEVRDERYLEWAAELPALLYDPDGGSGLARAARMLAYAADQTRGTASSRLRRAASLSPHEVDLVLGFMIVGPLLEVSLGPALRSLLGPVLDAALWSLLGGARFAGVALGPWLAEYVFINGVIVGLTLGVVLGGPAAGNGLRMHFLKEGRS